MRLTGLAKLHRDSLVKTYHARYPIATLEQIADEFALTPLQVKKILKES